MANYELWLATDTGTRLTSLDTSGGFSYARVANTVGAFTISLPDTFDESLLRVDRRVFIWRQVPGYPARLDFAGFVRRWRWSTDANGRTSLVISGPDLNDLLRRRIALPYTVSRRWARTDNADDILKTLVAYELGSSAYDAARDVSEFGLSVQADLAAGPSMTVECSHRRVIDTMREIVAASWTGGTRLYFDMVPTSETTMQFQTWINQRGRDLTVTTGTGWPIFGLEFGNLDSPALEYDYSTEVSFTYAVRPGYWMTAGDDSRIYASVWNRCEDSVPAASGSSNAELTAAAERRLSQFRPILRFTGNLRECSGALYGLNWDFGDAVTCRYRGWQGDGVINSLYAQVDGNGRETVTARMEIID